MDPKQALNELLGLLEDHGVHHGWVNGVLWFDINDVPEEVRERVQLLHRTYQNQ